MNSSEVGLWSLGSLGIQDGNKIAYFPIYHYQPSPIMPINAYQPQHPLNILIRDFRFRKSTPQRVFLLSLHSTKSLIYRPFQCLLSYETLS